MSDTDTLSERLIREIIEGCEGVTPGPWKVYHDTCAQCERNGTAEYGIAALPGGYHAPFGERLDAEHIARLDPATIRSAFTELLENRRALDAANATIERLREALDEIIAAHDANSGAEPSLSIFERAIDRARYARQAQEPTS